jgi:hypothetical protein
MTTNNTRALSEITLKLVSDYSDKTRQADNTKVLAIDALMADGFDKPSDFISPNGNGKNSASTCTQEEYDSLKQAIVLGFTKAQQALLEKPTKGLSDEKKVEKRYVQQQIGSRIKDLRLALEKRLNQNGSTEPKTKGPDQKKVSGKAPKISKPVEGTDKDAYIKASIDTLIETCKDMEKSRFNLTELVKLLSQAQNLCTSLDL